VRTKGAAYAAGRSWLLIKHRDDWSGAIDITEFAPRSVKSDGDFEDILAADTPAIWQSNRPAKGGATGAMLNKIIEKAAALKAATHRTNERAATTPSASKRTASSKRSPGERAKGRRTRGSK
jgi:hypothetical protein